MPSRLAVCVRLCVCECECVHGKAEKISLEHGQSSRRQSSKVVVGGGPPSTKISFIIKLIGPRDV